MTVVDPPGSGSIMAIAAHPDDIERWCARTLARAIDAGATVRLFLVTSGDKGFANPEDRPTVFAARREAKSGIAARELRLADVIFLRYPDGEVEQTDVLRGKTVEWIRRWRPDVVFTHDPEHRDPPYISSRDHQTVGRAALDAIDPCARDPLSFPEEVQSGLAPHLVRQVWLFASTRADAFVEISTGFGRKIAARLAHVSQTPDPDTLRDGWCLRARTIGAPAGLPLAEAFTILRPD